MQLGSPVMRSWFCFFQAPAHPKICSHLHRESDGKQAVLGCALEIWIGLARYVSVTMMKVFLRPILFGKSLVASHAKFSLATFHWGQSSKRLEGRTCHLCHRSWCSSVTIAVHICFGFRGKCWKRKCELFVLLVKWIGKATNFVYSKSNARNS